MSNFMTCRDICERIAAELNRRGYKVTPEAIWNLSPTGELWPVFELYRVLFLDDTPTRKSG